MTPDLGAFTTVGVTGKPGDPTVRETVEALLPMLTRRGHTVLLDADSIDAAGLPGITAEPREALIEACDLLVAIGGDGTLIHAARALAGRTDVALMGINRGRLGFLVDIPPDRLDEVERVLAGEYVLDERFLLTAEVRANADDALLAEGVAINEVVVHRWNTARMIELSTQIDGETLSQHRCDGFIVATPTGSTAYAMAGGGPIAHPNLRAMVLVSVCPHTLSHRPLVVDSASRIEVALHEGYVEHARVSCDSQQDLGLTADSRLVVKAHPTPLRLVHPPGYNYFNLLRSKLGWGGRTSHHVPDGA